jgi:hypothetical protein
MSYLPLLITAFAIPTSYVNVAEIKQDWIFRFRDHSLSSRNSSLLPPYFPLSPSLFIFPLLTSHLIFEARLSLDEDHNIIIDSEPQPHKRLHIRPKYP